MGMATIDANYTDRRQNYQSFAAPRDETRIRNEMDDFLNGRAGKQSNSIDRGLRKLLHF